MILKSEQMLRGGVHNNGSQANTNIHSDIESCSSHETVNSYLCLEKWKKLKAKQILWNIKEKSYYIHIRGKQFPGRKGA